MAESADETSCINRWQILIGVFGLGGLVATVVYAARSAKSALETVRHIEDLAGFLSTEEKSGAIKIIWADRHNDAS